MSFKLIKKKISGNDILESFVLKEEILDFCVINDCIFCIEKEKIVLIKNGLIKHDWWNKLTFNNCVKIFNFSSIFGYENNLYIVGQGGSQIYKVDVNLEEISGILSKSDVDLIKKEYLNCDNSKTKIFANFTEIVWSVESANRCFRLYNGRFDVLVGCGKGGYSISSPKLSRIWTPSGIAIHNGIYFSERKNGCIRHIQNDIVTQVISDCVNPESVKINNNKLYFLDDNKVQFINFEGGFSHKFVLYKSDGCILTFEVQKNHIYIMEKYHVKTRDKT